MVDQTSRTDSIVDRSAKILITGANGFIGSRVVEVLLKQGYRNLRCFVRPSSNLKRLSEILSAADTPSVEILAGNLLSTEDAERAVRGAAVVFHLAAGVEKTFAGCYLNSVVTTRNLLEAVVAEGTIRRFVHVSSFSVYSNWNIPKGSVLDETCEIEDTPQDRAEPYMQAKLEQEKVLLDYARKYNIQFVMLRPGAVYGPGVSQLTTRVGFNACRLFFHLGGSNRIPLTYVDNCADAIVQAGVAKGVDGEAFNVVDDDLPTSRQFLKLYKKHGRDFKSLYIPYSVFYALTWLWESSHRLLGRKRRSALNRRRCATYWKGNSYSNQKLKQLVGWSPKISFQEASRRYFKFIRDEVKP